MRPNQRQKGCKMKTLLKRIAATFMLAVSIITTINPLPVQASIAAPKGLGYFWMHEYEKNERTPFSFSKDPVHVKCTTTAACDGYQFKFALTNGKSLMTINKERKMKAGDYCGARCIIYTGNSPKTYGDHVTMVYARVYRYNQKGKKEYSAWTKPVLITPWPDNIKKVSVNKKTPSIKLKWNTIYGSDGYNVFISTTPGKWYWNQSTAQKATATTATIKTCHGRNLEKHRTYYVRIVTRKKKNSRFISSPEPYAQYYNYTFRID